MSGGVADRAQQARGADPGIFHDARQRIGAQKKVTERFSGSKREGAAATMIVAIVDEVTALAERGEIPR